MEIFIPTLWQTIAYLSCVPLVLSGCSAPQPATVLSSTVEAGEVAEVPRCSSYSRDGKFGPVCVMTLCRNEFSCSVSGDHISYGPIDRADGGEQDQAVEYTSTQKTVMCGMTTYLCGRKAVCKCRKR